MTNYEYMKILPKDEMVKFFADEASAVFNDIADEVTNYWHDDEARAAELEMWKKWLESERSEEND